MHEVQIKSIAYSHIKEVPMLILKYYKPLQSIQDLKSARTKQSSKC